MQNKLYNFFIFFNNITTCYLFYLPVNSFLDEWILLSDSQHVILTCSMANGLIIIYLLLLLIIFAQI